MHILCTAAPFKITSLIPVTVACLGDYGIFHDYSSGQSVTAEKPTRCKSNSNHRAAVQKERIASLRLPSCPLSDVAISCGCSLQYLLRALARLVRNQPICRRSASCAPDLPTNPKNL